MVGITRILCPVDLSPASQRALEYAIAMSRWYTAPVTALHLFPNVPIPDPVPLYRGQAVTLHDVNPETLRARLQDLVRRVADRAPIATQIADTNDVRRGILEHAAELSADLIVMGTHGRTGVGQLLLGSVTEAVAREADCPVMAVPPDAVSKGPLDVPFQHIVCAVDFSEQSQWALTLALELAQEADANLTLMHALEIPPELAALPTDTESDIPAVRAAAEAAALVRLRALVPPDAHTYCTIHTEVREGRADREILHVAAEQRADLIVLGVHGRSLFDRLIFGSNTHGVLCHASCPVLVARTPAPPGAT